MTTRMTLGLHVFFCRYEEMEREISEMKRENARLKSSGEELEAQLLNYRYRCGIPLTLLIIDCPISCTRVTSFFPHSLEEGRRLLRGRNGEVDTKSEISFAAEVETMTKDEVKFTFDFPSFIYARMIARLCACPSLPAFFRFCARACWH